MRKERGGRTQKWAREWNGSSGTADFRTIVVAKVVDLDVEELQRPTEGLNGKGMVVVSASKRGSFTSIVAEGGGRGRRSTEGREIEGCTAFAEEVEDDREAARRLARPQV